MILTGLVLSWADFINNLNMVKKMILSAALDLNLMSSSCICCILHIVHNLWTCPNCQKCRKKKLLQLLTFIIMFHVLFSSSQPLRGICHFVEESGSLSGSWQCCSHSLFFHSPRIWQTIRATVFADQVLCRSSNLGVRGFQRPLYLVRNVVRLFQAPLMPSK